ncbi:serine/threonine-protein kinase VRK2-like [Argonauta hians]
MKAIRPAKGYKHAAKFPRGEILESTDRTKRYVINQKIGVGGFGLIYTVSLVGCPRDEEYVAKVEPIGNGPLFNEFHALQRIARPASLEKYMKDKCLKHLGIPQFIANGVHEYKGDQYRFIIIPKYGSDLQTYIEKYGPRLRQQIVYNVALQVLDALECIHHHGYAHADLKAGNILIANDNNKIDKVYLIDYGLASKVIINDKHKPYKPEKKNAHNGTLLYTSVDAHDGADTSRRGDLQILGFCMYEWLTGNLPWKKHKENKEQVKREKQLLLENLSKISNENLKTYFKLVKKLEYDEKPDYCKLRRIFHDALKKIGKCCKAKSNSCSTIKIRESIYTRNRKSIPESSNFARISGGKLERKRKHSVTFKEKPPVEDTTKNKEGPPAQKKARLTSKKTPLKSILKNPLKPKVTEKDSEPPSEPNKTIKKGDKPVAKNKKTTKLKKNGQKV